VRFVPEPKPGGVRWLARLHPAAAEAYAASVLPLVPVIEAALPAAVVANRTAETCGTPPGLTLEPWPTARRRFRALVHDLAAGAGAALTADVRDCYGSISLPVLARALQGLGCAATDVEQVLARLGALGRAGVRGLPVGPAPSAVLANAVLLHADRRLAAEGFTHVRWVDDVLVFATDARAARRALRLLAEALGDLGLGLAPQKTRVILDPAAIRGAGPAARSGPGPRGHLPRG
jgi:hypothetical protein